MNVDNSAFWQRKTQADWEKDWENTVQAKHRDQIVEQLGRIAPFDSLLEVGCGTMINLWRIAQAFPGVQLGGVDVNEGGIRLGRRRFVDDGLPLPGTYIGALPDAIEDNPGVADVVLSCYTCAYVPPRLFDRTMLAITRAAKKAIIFAEPMSDAKTAGMSARVHTATSEFAHSYIPWFNDRDPAGREWAKHWVEVTPPADRMNRIVVARRKG